MFKIDWEPDKTSDKPIYLQIKEYIVTKVNTRQWQEGMKLPSQRELSNIFHVNRSTIINAFEELKADGVIESWGRGGTKISSGILWNKEYSTDWKPYINDSMFISNYYTMQQINKLEFQPGVIRLSSSEPSPNLFSKIQMAKVFNEVTGSMTNIDYTEPKGMFFLRSEICKYLKTLNINVNPDQIMISSGALQGIHIVLQGLMQFNSSVILEKPSYLYSFNLLQSLGLRRIGIPVDKEGMEVKLLESRKPKNKEALLFTIPNYQNPTGTVMSQQRKHQLLETCRKQKIPIIEDDVYEEIWFGKERPSTIKSLDKNDSVIYIGSVSKTLGPGFRIGWVVGPENVIEHLSDIKMQNDYGSSSIAQLIVAKWMETGLFCEYSEKLREDMRQRRDIALLCLEKYFKKLAVWSEPEGGYNIWVKLNTGGHMYKLFNKACEKGVLFYPGYLFDNEMNSYIRISYSYADKKDLEKGIKILADIITDINNEED